MPTATTAREFVRNFARLRRMAARGKEVIIRDHTGKSYVFRAMGGHGAALGEQLGDLRGAIATGVRVKSLRSFGRSRA